MATNTQILASIVEQRSANLRWRQVEGVLRALGLEIKKRGNTVSVSFPICGTDRRDVWCSHMRDGKQVSLAALKDIADRLRCAGLDERG